MVEGEGLLVQEGKTRIPLARVKARPPMPDWNSMVRLGCARSGKAHQPPASNSQDCLEGARRRPARLPPWPALFFSTTGGRSLGSRVTWRGGGTGEQCPASSEGPLLWVGGGCMGSLGVEPGGGEGQESLLAGWVAGALVSVGCLLLAGQVRPRVLSHKSAAPPSMHSFWLSYDWICRHLMQHPVQGSPPLS